MAGIIGYYIFFGLNWLITLLPLKVLYLFSDFFFIFVFYFPGYRRKVVAENLKNSFPEKTKEELAIIEKKFYHHFCDLIVEIAKLTHISRSQLKKRMKLNNPQLINKLYDEGRDIIAIFAHYGNWEWTNILSLHVSPRVVPVYKPLNNKFFDRFMLNMRSKNDCRPVPMSNVIREIILNRNDNKRGIYGIMSDQTPPLPDIKFRTKFLNQDTPVYTGAEKIAVKYDMAVVFLKIQKVKRGYYEITFELLFEHTNGVPEHLITQTHVKRLEEIIIEKPEYWLWTHRRWKHKRLNNPDD